MKENCFVIPGRLPGYNEQIYEDRKSRYAGSALRADTETMIALHIRSAANRGNTRAIRKPCRITFDWSESTRKRDLDNIFSGKKYILDAMQQAGILPNDSQKWVIGLTDEFHLVPDRRDENVRVTITEEDLT